MKSTKQPPALTDQQTSPWCHLQVHLDHYSMQSSVTYIILAWPTPIHQSRLKCFAQPEQERQKEGLVPRTCPVCTTLTAYYFTQLPMCKTCPCPIAFFYVMLKINCKFCTVTFILSELTTCLLPIHFLSFTSTYKFLLNPNLKLCQLIE